MQNGTRALLSLAASLAVTACAFGQTAPLEQFDAPIRIDSGFVASPIGQRDVVYSTAIVVPDAAWLRLIFDKVALGAVPGGVEETILRLTSLHDGAVQTMNAEHLEQWGYTSAYFNGNALLVEIVASPEAGDSYLIVNHAWAGVLKPNVGGTRSICGPTDDRLPSDDARVGRLMPIGCTCWMFNDANRQFLTAGHCIDGSIGDIVEFNVPPSDPNGQVNHPGPEDQYPVDATSVQSNNGGTGYGDDWAYFGCFVNSTTGLQAVEAQGDYFVLEMPPPVQGQEIRITGYGGVVPPIPPEWNRIQKTHVGPYFSFEGTRVMYTTDTSGGNSGSPVILEDTGVTIGIHSHGGCESNGGNTGTGANHPELQNALANPLGVCIPYPSIFFEFPNGLPEALHPDGESVRVHLVDGVGGSPEPGTGELHYRRDLGWTSLPMVEISPNVYDAVFPPIVCGSEVDFYFSAEDTTGETVTDPVLAPDHVYTRFVAVNVAYALNDDLSSDPGWSTEDLWAFGEPMGQGGQFGNPDPTSGFTGPNVYGYNLDGDYQNSLPERHLTTTLLDCSELTNVTLRFKRWLGVERPAWDHAYVRVSSNGIDWTTIWENDAEIIDPGWIDQVIDITDLAAGHTGVQIRWTMGETDSAFAYCGWNIDDVQVYGFECDAPCPADVNGDTVVDVSDLLLVLAAWGTTGAGGEDINGDGIVDVADLLLLLAAWGPCA